MPQSPRDYSELTALMQTMIGPLIQKFASLEEKVDRLSQDRATRSDIEKLRSELAGNYVPRDSYEPRHAALVERDLALETLAREMYKNAAEETKTLRLGIAQELRELEALIKQQQDAQLSAKDRTWLRWSQLLGVTGIVVAALDWLSQHLRF